MADLFSKFESLDTERQVGVLEIPHGVALEGITHYPGKDGGTTEIQRITFSRDAAVKLAEILNEWVHTPVAKNGIPF